MLKLYLAANPELAGQHSLPDDPTAIPDASFITSTVTGVRDLPMQVCGLSFACVDIAVFDLRVDVCVLSFEVTRTGFARRTNCLKLDVAFDILIFPADNHVATDATVLWTSSAVTALDQVSSLRFY